MRILHLSTSLKGGAGIFCRRLAEFQVACGHQVSIVTRNGAHARGCDVVEITDVATRMRSKIITGLNGQVSSRRVETAFAPLSMSAGALPVVTRLRPDVVHVHNWYNLLSANDIGVLSDGHRTVATLHDERMYTGGCHTTGTCAGYHRNCASCPQAKRPFREVPKLAHRGMQESILRASSADFVAPSAWLFERAQASSILKSARVSHIPNGVPSEFQRLKNPAALLARFQSKDGDWNIGWISGKGKTLFGAFLHALQFSLSPSERERVRVLTTDGLDQDEAAFPVVQVGRVHSDSAMAEFWSACDVVISTTRADNFPSAITEALSVGTPVLGFGAGGSGEAIALTGGGAIFPDGDVTAMADYLASVLRRPEELARLSRAASDAGFVFSMELCNQRYEGLYSQ